MSSHVLALDVSTNTGWSRFVDGEYKTSGALPKVRFQNFNVNNDPHLCPEYPYNIVDGAAEVVRQIEQLVADVLPDVVVIENTNKGKNRHTQRLLEFIHLELLKMLRLRQAPVVYMDTSEWRRIVELRLSSGDKKNNRDVSSGKKRGRVTTKHLAVRMVNERYDLKLKVKDNDQADAVLLGLAYSLRHTPQETC
jgi:hypothetical protein